MSPDNRVLAIGRGRSVELWDVDGAQRIAVLPAVVSATDGSRVVTLAFSPDGKRLAAGFGWFNF